MRARPVIKERLELADAFSHMREFSHDLEHLIERQIISPLEVATKLSEMAGGLHERGNDALLVGGSGGGKRGHVSKIATIPDNDGDRGSARRFVSLRSLNDRVTGP